MTRGPNADSSSLGEDDGQEEVDQENGGAAEEVPMEKDKVASAK